MSMRWHPDGNPVEKKDEATERFQKISASYARLSEQGGCGGPSFFGFGAAYYSDKYYDKKHHDKYCNDFYGEYYDEYYDDTTDEEEDDIRAEYFRRGAQQAHDEQARHAEKQQDEQARHAEKQQRGAWLNQFRRVTTVEVSQRSIRVSADSKHSRLLNFPEMKLPSNYFWELQYRPVLPEDQNPSTNSAPVLNHIWGILFVRNGLQATIADLTPGTEYAIRARPCITEMNCTVKHGEWNMEVRIMTQAKEKKKKTKKKKTKKTAPLSAAAAPAAAADADALPKEQNQQQQPRDKAAKNRAKWENRKAKKKQASGA